jgi:hypothetical protein
LTAPAKPKERAKTISHLSATVAFFKMNAKKYKPLEFKEAEKPKDDEEEDDSGINGMSIRKKYIFRFCFLDRSEYKGEEKERRGASSRNK